MNKLFLVAILAALCFTSQAAIHAVLTAGSDGYGNYRHQADICRKFNTISTSTIIIYQILYFF